MGEFQNYAGEPKAVQRVARNIVIGGGGRLENIQGQDANDFINDADEIINSKLSDVYLTPLIKITRDGDTFFPHPIPNIARRIAAALMVQTVYSEVDINVSAYAEKFGAQAVTQLEAHSYGISRGGLHLEGQTILAKNNFANPRVLPRENMPTPRTTI